MRKDKTELEEQFQFNITELEKLVHQYTDQIHYLAERLEREATKRLTLLEAVEKALDILEGNPKSLTVERGQVKRLLAMAKEYSYNGKRRNT